MSDKSGGFFSSVGRFFSGGSATKSNPEEKSPKISREAAVSNSSPSASTTAPPTYLKDIISVDNTTLASSNESAGAAPQSSRIGSRLRYLSPSVLERNDTINATNSLEIDVDPMPDIFSATPSSTSRKRQLTELDKQILPQSFRSESVKRSRFLNRSLLESTLKGTMNNDKRTDMSWCGELTANHSPSSSITNFSLLSRRSGANTNGSLSTRTQEIFKKLEGANTPAKEVQRMSMLRAGLSRPERWGSTSKDNSSTATPPPLRKAADAIPSRIQLISKSMSLSARRAPYWTDLTRKRTVSKNQDNGSSDTSSLRSLNGNFASTELSSVFSLDQPTAKKTDSSSTSASTNSSNIKKPHIAILKGPDGKPVGRNTFKLTDDVEEDDESSQRLPPLPEATLSNPQPLQLTAESAPKRGFLDNLSFSFSAPVDVVSAVGTATTISSASSNRSESNDADSDSSDEHAEKQSSESSGSSSSSSSEVSEDSEESDVEVGEDNADEVKESRPQTSADTISTADGSNPSNQSSKNPSPKTSKEGETVAISVAPAATKWTCTECFTDWDEKLKDCGCCGTPRGGAGAPAGQKPAEKQLVSNLSSFAPANSNFKFGFGGGPSSTTAPSTTTLKPTSFGASTSSTVPLFGKSTNIPPVSTTVSSVSVISSASTASTTSTVSSVPTPASSESRVDWECPECFVSNKAFNDKCVCCSYVKYASGSSDNVFGDRAFKPVSTTGSAFKFGFGGESTTPKPVFGFSAAKPAETTAAPALPPPAASSLFGFSAKPATSAPEPVKAESVSTNIAKPTEPVASNPVSTPSSTAPIVQKTSTAPLFGSSSGSLFGSGKSITEPSKTNLFGASESEKTAQAPAAPLPVATAPGLVAPAAGSLFGSSSSNIANPFGGSSLFGSSKNTSEQPKPISTIQFGNSAAASATDAPKPNLFGNIAPTPAAAPVQPAPTTTASLFGSGSSSTTNNLFSSKPADSAAPSIFGKPIQFGGEVGTTTTDGVPTKRGLFSSDAAPKLSFGGDQKAGPPAFGGFGGSSTPASSGSMFGGSSSTSMFGGSAAPAFKPSSSTAAPAFGGSSTITFGGTPASTGFGAFGGKTTQPGMSTSSSTNSLFGQSQAPAESSNPFGTTNNNGFNFGASSTSTAAPAGGVFQFGSAAPAAPAPTAAGGTFQFGNNLTVPPSVPGSMDNAFAYQASSGVGGRKLAMARRRNRK